VSIVQWHHFAYMIISLALLGYGASGTFIALSRSYLEPRFEMAFAASALLFSIAMIVCFIVAQRVPFNALEIVWDRGQFLNLTVIYLVFFVPFFFAACCIGLAFTCRGEDASRIYFFDLFGAGLGAMLIIALLFAVSPQMALVLLVLLPLAGSVLVATTLASRLPLGIAQLTWLALLALGIPQTQLDLRISEYKGLSQALEVIDSRVLGQASSPLGLITVVDSPTVPVRHAPGLSFNTRHIPPEQLAVFTDADGMSAITRYDGDPGSVAYLGDLTAALPFSLLEKPAVLILGAGTGNDVLLSLYHGASRVDAVELNPQMTELVAQTHADFAGRSPRIRCPQWRQIRPHTDRAARFLRRLRCRRAGTQRELHLHGRGAARVPGRSRARRTARHHPLDKDAAARQREIARYRDRGAAAVGRERTGPAHCDDPQLEYEHAAR
jgi:hypothetical protein